MAARLNLLARTIVAPGLASSSASRAPSAAITSSSPLPPPTSLTLAGTGRLQQQQQQQHQTSSRAMSTSTTSAAEPRKWEWLVVIPDKPGTLAKRLEVRPQHFAGLEKAKASGAFKMGGAILEDMPADDEVSSLKFAGSTIMVLAESRQAVIDLLKDDIYVESGVWDLEKAMIWPAKIAFRYP